MAFLASDASNGEKGAAANATKSSSGNSNPSGGGQETGSLSNIMNQTPITQNAQVGNTGQTQQYKPFEPEKFASEIQDLVKKPQTMANDIYGKFNTIREKLRIPSSGNIVPLQNIPQQQLMSPNFSNPNRNQQVLQQFFAKRGL
jgi:hypothetical protein